MNPNFNSSELTSSEPISNVTDEVYTLTTPEISRILETYIKPVSLASDRSEPQLEEVFRSILLIANEYVPSISGSVCLAAPIPAEEHEQHRSQDRSSSRRSGGKLKSYKPGLVYIASFGPQSSLIPGTRLDVNKGITGRVFRSGKSCVRNDVRKDAHFFAGIDEKTQSKTQSILCVPILIGNASYGVVSLLNRQDPRGFRQRDLKLMEIFCRYLSTSIQNLIDFQQQRELALRDHLSGLHNDRYFYAQMLHEIEGCQRYGGDLSLLFLDLDHFKGVVDTHGHLVGSQVLAEVGSLLRQAVNHPGATLARYGGDEYVVILPGCGEEQACEIGEIIRATIADHVYLAEPKKDGIPALKLRNHFTASIGIASFRRCNLDGLTPEKKRTQFIRKADEAMYLAKSQGKNRVVVHQNSD